MILGDPLFYLINFLGKTEESLRRIPGVPSLMGPWYTILRILSVPTKPRGFAGAPSHWLDFREMNSRKSLRRIPGVPSLMGPWYIILRILYHSAASSTRFLDCFLCISAKK